MNRRDFVKSVALATSTVSLLPDVLGRTAAFAAPGSGLGSALGAYFEGVVINTEPGSLVVSTPDKVAAAAILTSDARVWRGGLTTPEAIAVGDYVQVLAAPDAAPLTISKIWANIVNLRGALTEVASDHFVLTSLNGSLKYALNTTPNTEVTVAEGAAYSDGATAFVIGFKDPLTGVFTATLVDVVSTVPDAA